MKKQLINEVKQLQKIAGILKETWHPDDPASTEIDGTEEDPDDFDDISEEDSTNKRVSIPTKAVKGLDGKTYNLITLYQNTRNGLSGYTYSLSEPYTFTGVVDQESGPYRNVKLDPGYENIEATGFVKNPKNGNHLIGRAQKLSDLYQIHKGYTVFKT
jgi:hypothetical protein